jgi:hypothetical protein
LWGGGIKNDDTTNSQTTYPAADWSCALDQQFAFELHGISTVELHDIEIKVADTIGSLAAASYQSIKYGLAKIGSVLRGTAFKIRATFNRPGRSL